MSGRALGGAAGPSLTVAQVIAVADATRRCIERDLHDGLQQQLVVLALQVRAVEAMVPAELLELRAELSRVVDEHTNLLDQLREIAHGIHPAVLSEDGLEPALKTLARRSPIPVELTVRADARLPEEVELAAYYIVAEALTNTAKYSHASLVDVLVQTRGRTLRVAVRDDGVGGADPGRGTGLLGLKERAEAIGGTVSLHSPPAAGTLLDAALPLGEKSRHPAPIPPPPGRDGLSRGSERAYSSQVRPACANTTGASTDESESEAAASANRTMTASRDAGKSLGRAAVRLKRDQDADVHHMVVGDDRVRSRDA